ncbi:MAG: RDD family protein [Wolbachia endosymbiont of Alcedoecus sp.]|nr:RDD family protein [Wolbachia endosymbiont of Alcedoecus sp.]
MGILIFLGKDDFLQKLKQQEAETLMEEIVGTVIILVPYMALKILMVTRLGGTPGKLLCGMRIKDANTLQNVTLMQATIRCLAKEGIWIIYSFLSDLLPNYVSACLLVVLILVLIFAIFDRCKQTFYDKFANTVVIDYKPS